ncbi:hypothetical protein J4E86_002822 [Alternaria arbusti]|uniref:uncharacterized protein n=1 Tax=Alternaria arbusti TaxID=232088 RepID=UPI00221FFA71|nr:uncharacterized protein J4E86_002822 [Alternaria arbusti]KAI4959101.1 hypothetical protein J4E86_002822 [Alternaria arbusti]
MQDSDAAERLRDLLARSDPKTPVQPTLQHTKTIAPVPFPPVTAQACTIPPKPLDLEYPRVKLAKVHLRIRSLWVFEIIFKDNSTALAEQ